MAKQLFGLGRADGLYVDGERTVARGDDWVEVDRITRCDLLQQADAGFRAYIELYEQRTDDLQPPRVGSLSTRDLVACGLGSRLARFRLGPQNQGADLHLPGQRFEVSTQSQDATLLSEPIARRAISRILVSACLTWQPQFFTITGRIGSDFLYLHAAALPLRGEEGEITDVLLPFVSKLGNIPSRLRHEFFTRHIQHP